MIDISPKMFVLCEIKSYLRTFATQPKRIVRPNALACLRKKNFAINARKNTACVKNTEVDSTNGGVGQRKREENAV